MHLLKQTEFFFNSLVCYSTQNTGKEKRERKVAISFSALRKTNKAQPFKLDTTFNRTKMSQKSRNLFLILFTTLL